MLTFADRTKFEALSGKTFDITAPTLIQDQLKLSQNRHASFGSAKNNNNFQQSNCNDGFDGNNNNFYQNN